MESERFVNWYRVAKSRELMFSGFYDDPDILDMLLERCLGVVLRVVNRVGAEETGRHRCEDSVRYPRGVGACPAERTERAAGPAKTLGNDPA